MNIWRLLGLHTASRAERHATLWVAVMFFACMTATFVLRPLRGQFGVSYGVYRLDWLYMLTVIGTIVLVVPFWWLANRMASRRFVPIALHVFTAGFVGLSAWLPVIGDYEWEKAPVFGQVFWGGFNAVNLAVPALVWIHAVEHFGKLQAKRLFGLIALGGTLGTIAGSWVSGLLSGGGAPLWVVPVVAAGMLQVAHLAFRLSQRPCLELEGGDTTKSYDRGGLLGGLKIVLRDRRALQISIYMMLVGFVATAFYAAQTELVGDEIRAGKQQHTWFADIGFYGNLLVLGLQLFWTGRLMSSWTSFAMLASLPLVSILGLGLWSIWPTAFAIFGLQVVRRGAQYAFEKPAREVLYTPLDIGTKHKVKFFVDTCALRLGDLLGAVAQVQLRKAGLGVGAIATITIAFALLWIAIAWSLGRDQRSSSPIS